MMRWVAPQVLLLALPLGVLLWRLGKVRGPAFGVRVLVLGLLVLALAGPLVRRGAGGTDVIFLVDRSRSMPATAQRQATELISYALAQRREGDRVGVVSFARGARIEMSLSDTAQFGGFNAQLDSEASELSGGLDAVGDVVDPERRGRVVVISDGKATDGDAKTAARRLAGRGFSVDHRWVGRPDDASDVAVTQLGAPAAVGLHEPFQLSATVMAGGAVEATVTLLRNGSPLVKTSRALTAGANILTFRDLVERPGQALYQLKVEAPGDSVVENDVSSAAVRIEGAPRVMLVTSKPGGTLAKVLNAPSFKLDVRAPGPIDLGTLEGVAAVVLEDVDANLLGEGGLRALAEFVTVAGGGLLMTGGPSSFGEGGYRKSPVEAVLPVSLELREEQRKTAMALSVIMDCSCSMGVTIADGRTKMELAAEGVVGALQLLNERDEASVSMVDTSPHEIFSMRPVGDGLPLDKVAKGFSGGGGIYIGVGLQSAKSSILSSQRPTRHVVLFADAADSVEPSDYRQTLTELRAQKVTVSVIGMGSPSDAYASLLKEIATRGAGRVYFAADVTSLPRIFSQDTIAVAGSSFIETTTPTMLGPDLGLLGRLPTTKTPTCGGYNLTYLKPLASVGLTADDETHAPLLAFWPKGAGRVAAVMMEVDGASTGALREWDGLRATLEQLVRWVMPIGEMRAPGVVRTQMVGERAHVTVDFDPTRSMPWSAAKVVLLSSDGKVAPVEQPLRWEDAERLGAEVALPSIGTWYPVVMLGEVALRAPPATLPWVSEYASVAAKVGQSQLAAMSKAGQGVERLAMADLFSEGPQSQTHQPMAPWLVGLALMALVAEVLMRRFYAVGVSARKAPLPAVLTQAPPTDPPPSAVEVAMSQVKKK